MLLWKGISHTSNPSGRNKAQAQRKAKKMCIFIEFFHNSIVATAVAALANIRSTHSLSLCITLWNTQKLSISLTSYVSQLTSLFFSPSFSLLLILFTQHKTNNFLTQLLHRICLFPQLLSNDQLIFTTAPHLQSFQFDFSLKKYSNTHILFLL